MKVRVETVGVTEMQGRTVVLDTRGSEGHNALVEQAMQALQLPGEREDRRFTHRYTYRMKSATDRGAFPSDAHVADMVRIANPAWATVNSADYDATIRFGRFFAFCTANETTDSDFLTYLGLADAPTVVSRFGEQASALSRHIDNFALPTPKFGSTAAIATDRLAYKPGDPVTLFALALRSRESATGTARIALTSGGRPVPGYGGDLVLRSGLGVAHFQNLPLGEYTASFQWDDRASECSFTVGEYTRSAAEAIWVDGPTVAEDAWCGTVLVSLYGVPLSAGVELEFTLVSEAQPKPRPVLCTTDEGGLVQLRLPNTHPDCRVVACSWQEGREHTAQLSLPGAESLKTDLGVQAMTASHEGSEQAAGLHVSQVPDATFPLRLVSAIGHSVQLVATRDLDGVAWTGTFPSHPLQQGSARLRAGDEVVVDLPARCGYGFLYVGALAGEECFEASFPIFAPTELRLKGEVPEVAKAGSRIKIALGVNTRTPVAAAVIVRDSRLHAGGGLEASAAAARLSRLREEYTSSTATKRLPIFSECLLSATLAMECLCTTSPKPLDRGIGEILEVLFGGGGSSDMRRSFTGSRDIDIPAFYRSTPQPTSLHRTARYRSAPAEAFLAMAAPPMPAQAPGGQAGMETAPLPVQKARSDAREPSERFDTLYADVVLIEGGRAEIEVEIPPVPAGYTVEVLAVDPEFLGWTLYRTTFRAQRPVEIYADALPACAHPLDSGRITGTIAITTLHDSFGLEVSRDGNRIPCYLSDGTPLADQITCTPNLPTEIKIPIEPGRFQIMARSGGESHTVTAVVLPGDRISERVCRLHVLETGAEFLIGSRDHLFDLRFAPSPDDLFKTCGNAVANYDHACCEQTASKMLGAWLAYAAGDEPTRFQALGTLRMGVERLESMWRPDGFAMYPNLKEAHSYWGPGAYKHLCEMRPMLAAIHADEATDDSATAILSRLDSLTVRAATIYGQPVKKEITSCQDAYLALRDRPAESLAWVAKRWPSLYASIGNQKLATNRGALVNWVATKWPALYASIGNEKIPTNGGAVVNRSEICYAAATLLSEKAVAQAHRAELLETLRWIGGQLRSGGRLYSTVDSAALMGFLSAARSFGLLSAGKVSFDGGQEMFPEEASRELSVSVPNRIQCTEGQAHLFVDGLFERLVNAEETKDSLSATFEIEGRRREQLALGEVANLVIRVPKYEAGMLAQVILPPCLAYEQGGARLQSFQRDLEGHDTVRVPCRAVTPTGPQGEHGMVALQNMFVEESLEAITFEVTISTVAAVH